MVNEQIVAETGETTNTPRPPLLVGRGMPDKNLLAKVGMLSAYFSENYARMGPIYRSMRGDKEVIVISGIEANQFIHEHGRHYLRADETRSLQVQELGIDRLMVGTQGDEHYHLRKRLKQGFSRSILNGKYTRLVDICRGHIQQWQPGQRVLIEQAIPRIFADPLAYGSLTHPMDGRFDQIMYWVRTHIAATSAGSLPFSVTQQPAYLAAKETALAYAIEVIEAHRNGTTEERPVPDLVDEVMAMMAEDSTFMSEQELRTTIVLGVFIGGLDTSAFTVAFLLYELLKHPDVMAQAIAEVDDAFADGPLTPDKIRKLSTLHYALMETMRLYPVSGALQYTVARPFDFAGYRVDEGATLMIATMVPHLLPECYPDPLTFDIDRYQSPRNEHQRVGVHAPYGAGPHTCLGAGVADVLMTLLVATILHTVRFELDPPDYHLVIKSQLIPYPHNFHIRITEQRG
jgi:cytochrome P450